MLEVFNPVPWSEFCNHNLDRLSAHDLSRGLIVRFRWLSRQLCVTAVYSVDHEDALISYPNPLDLRIPSGDGSNLRSQMREFAEDEVSRRHKANPYFQRVMEQRGKAHLVRPYRSSAACGLRSMQWHGPAEALSCKECIRKAYRSRLGYEPAYAEIALLDSELQRIGSPQLPKDGLGDITAAIMKSVRACSRGGDS